MSDEKNTLTDDHVDDHVEAEIQRCFSDDDPKNFFVLAGAGSGKTRSLINTMSFINDNMGKWLSDNGKKAAVITYTNAAVEEISRRMQYNPIFAVSTIHSFLWELIKNYTDDIKEWLKSSIQTKKDKLTEELKRSRKESAAQKKEEEITRATARLNKIQKANHFVYSPDSDNQEVNSLNHEEVVKIGCFFIENKPTMQKILISQYPIILIDECQDTKKELIDAINSVIEKRQNPQDKFIVGMFGDTMQRIYLDGKDNLENSLFGSWEKPVKVMNHRSAKRIVQLANSIRGTIDDQKQQERSDAPDGTVRLFIADNASDEDLIEKKAAAYMAEETKDEKWNDDSEYKSLILEHSMAASRLGFSDLFEPLNDSKCFSTSLRNGTISELSFLSKVISPLVAAYKAGDNFEVTGIVKRHSPLLKNDLFSGQTDQLAVLKEVRKAVDSLMSLWDNNKDPSCLEILRSINSTGLFIPSNKGEVEKILDCSAEEKSSRIIALNKALSVPFSTLEKYSMYVTDNTRFATHQGIKGLEFPRVMVIIDEEKAKGKSFSYEKLFGAKPLTDTDIKNQNEHKDNSISRTARLFYVTCTRARESLAIVAYTDNVKKVRETALSQQWFNDDEIVELK